MASLPHTQLCAHVPGHTTRAFPRSARFTQPSFHHRSAGADVPSRATNQPRSWRPPARPSARPPERPSAERQPACAADLLNELKTARQRSWQQRRRTNSPVCLSKGLGWEVEWSGWLLLSLWRGQDRIEQREGGEVALVWDRPRRLPGRSYMGKISFG